MQITLNGKLLSLVEGLSIVGLLERKGLKPETVIVEYNHELLKREEWPSTFLEEKDIVEVLHFVGGG